MALSEVTAHGDDAEEGGPVDKAGAQGRQARLAPADEHEPRGPGHPHAPATLYNAMIAPIEKYNIRGAIWYQGESNTGDGLIYEKKISNLMEIVPLLEKVVASRTPLLIIEEDVEAEELGGASMHNQISGVAHFEVPDDEACIKKIRQLVGDLPPARLPQPVGEMVQCVSDHHDGAPDDHLIGAARGAQSPVHLVFRLVNGCQCGANHIGKAGITRGKPFYHPVIFRIQRLNYRLLGMTLFCELLDIAVKILQKLQFIFDFLISLFLRGKNNTVFIFTSLLIIKYLNFRNQKYFLLKPFH